MCVHGAVGYHSANAGGRDVDLLRRWSVNVRINILAFDTATNACSAALQVDGKIYSRHEIAPQQHAKLILPMIQDLLSEAKINLSDLTVIAFGCGPGSFMGVRLATATARLGR